MDAAPPGVLYLRTFGVHAANLQRLLDRALAAEQSEPGETFVAHA